MEIRMKKVHIGSVLATAASSVAVLIAAPAQAGDELITMDGARHCPWDIIYTDAIFSKAATSYK